VSPKSDKEKLEERLHQHRKIKGEQVRSLVIDEAVEELVTDMEEHVGDSQVLEGAEGALPSSRRSSREQ